MTDNHYSSYDDNLLLDEFSGDGDSYGSEDNVYEDEIGFIPDPNDYEEEANSLGDDEEDLLYEDWIGGKFPWHAVALLPNKLRSSVRKVWDCSTVGHVAVIWLLPLCFMPWCRRVCVIWQAQICRNFSCKSRGCRQTYSYRACRRHMTVGNVGRHRSAGIIGGGHTTIGTAGRHKVTRPVRRHITSWTLGRQIYVGL